MVLNQISVIFLYIFERKKKEIIFIALSRVYFALGEIGGPEKDQNLELVVKFVSS